MTDSTDNYADNYDDVMQYSLEEGSEKGLIDSQRELVFMWTTKAAEPVGVVQCYLFHDGKFWMTCTESRKRVPALRRDSNSCICISEKTSEVNPGLVGYAPGRTVTYKGTTKVHDPADREVKDWFYRDYAQNMHGPSGQDAVDQFIEYLDTPTRVVLEFTPGKRIGYDGAKMVEATKPIFSDTGD